MGNKQGKNKGGSKSVSEGDQHQRSGKKLKGHKRHSIIGKFSTTLMQDETTPIEERATLDDFELLKLVGRGTFGKVIQVRYKKNEQIYAMKVLRKDLIWKRNQVEHTKTERRILEQCDHPFIVSLRFAFQTEDKLYMVLDYFNGGELFYHLSKAKKFDENQTRFYVAQMVLALEYMHERNIIYRDLKPENVLLDEQGYIKITDFGLSKENIELPNGAKTFCGTPEYLAPEIVLNKGHGKQVDWWALGCITFELLTGLPPYFSKNRQRLYDMILKQPVKFPSYVSSQARSFINGLMEKNLKNRLTAPKIRKHEFFAGIDWALLELGQLEAPFVPKVREGQLDSNNFERMFTSEEIKDTPVDSLSFNKRNEFGNFTYEGDSDLLN
mmetsp:Transcript_18992/g.21462  ORF Transcript_18992/g.21462 Transcript_18992/m.21462 type:complete len:383 (-) Transcript_18992:1930-3078(-)|eukprot:CAMPEP_0115015010 /NCGR_PEP_ID=MMETSP0216-20121206/26469_1 /TAXON_ID=223996 /ORGANISM="Protocruzia adherens, Strain Boccale" /LENGTH=382 /DNA_ID=CAMNT_0002384959 /DNA_START=51 /DNA_END=1199 /DNA_ORIENTATION=+